MFLNKKFEGSVPITDPIHPELSRLGTSGKREIDFVNRIANNFEIKMRFFIRKSQNTSLKILEIYSEWDYSDQLLPRASFIRNSFDHPLSVRRRYHFIGIILGYTEKGTKSTPCGLVRVFWSEM